MGDASRPSRGLCAPCHADIISLSRLWPFFCMQNNRHVQPALSGRVDLRKHHRENQLGRKAAPPGPWPGRVAGEPVCGVVPLPGAVRHWRGHGLGGGDGVSGDAGERAHQDR